MYTPATYRARGVDVKVAPGLKVGYLPGTGDEVQASLENLGVHATTLTMDDVAGGQALGLRRGGAGCAGVCGESRTGGGEWAAAELCEERRRGDCAVQHGAVRLWAVSLLAGERGEGCG